MKQILCVSNTAWHGPPNRTAQIIGRMKNYRVLFIDPPADPQDSLSARDWRSEGEQISKNMTLLSAPPKSKAARRGGFWDVRYQRKLARYLSARVQEYALDKPVLWLTDPSGAELIGRFAHGPVVFDCQEALPEASGNKLSGPALRRAKQIERLTREAKAVLTHSEGMRKALEQWNPGTIVIPNGVDFELFQRARDEALAFPNDLFTVKNPIFGHIGALGDHLELSFVEQAAAAHPEWSFVFVGEYQDSEPVRRLKQLRNIFLLGFKSQKQLPLYLCRFDVCVSLYKSSELSRDISPMKLFEYLASGKPIVSTPQPAQTLDYADVVYMAGTAGEWIEACRKAISERDAWKVRQRISYAKASSWDARVVEVEHTLTEKDVFS